MLFVAPRKNKKGGSRLQKISIEVLEKAIKEKLTSAELDLLLYVARFQDEAGRASGIYYKDVCESIGISYQGFYDCKRSLQNKGLIDAQKRNYYDWDITILNNSFPEKKTNGRGYVSVSSKMVKSAAFRKLRANAKMMALYLLREWNINRKKAKRDSYAILKENFLNKFKELGFTNRMARAYLGELKPFLSVYLEDGRKYFLTFKKNEVYNAGESENEEKRLHDFDTACRRNKVKGIEAEQKQDILTVLRQYHVKIVKKLDFNLSSVVEQSLEILNGSKQKKKWRRELNPKLIHKIIQEELFVRA